MHLTARGTRMSRIVVEKVLDDGSYVFYAGASAAVARRRKVCGFEPCDRLAADPEGPISGPDQTK